MTTETPARSHWRPSPRVPGAFRCSAADSVRRSARTFLAIVSAVARSIGATSFPLMITISASRPVAPVALASSVPGRAGIPAANTTPPNASAATMVAPAATGRGHRLGYPAASRARSADSRPRADELDRALGSRRRVRATPSIATFVANSVVCGAIRSVASRPTPIAYTRRRGPTRGDRLRVGDHEEEEDQDLRRGHEQPPELPARDRPEVPARRHRVAARGEHADAGCEREPEADRDLEEVAAARGSTKPPTTMSASARTSARRHRPPPERRAARPAARRAARKQRTRPKFDGLKRWRPRKRITYFESSETAAVAAKIHQPFMLHQSPCSVPGTGG